MQKQLAVGSLETQEPYNWRPDLFKKSQNAQIPCISPFSCLKTYDLIILPEEDRTHLKLWIMDLWARTKFEQSSQFLLNSVCSLWYQLHYYMLSSIKCAESELSGIKYVAKSIVKLVTENVVRGSPGIHFMHMNAKTQSSRTHFWWSFDIQLINSGRYFLVEFSFLTSSRRCCSIFDREQCKAWFVPWVKDITHSLYWLLEATWSAYWKFDSNLLLQIDSKSSLFC